MASAEGANLPTLHIPRSSEELQAYWGERTIKGWTGIGGAAGRFLSDIGLPAEVGPELRFAPDAQSQDVGRITLGRWHRLPIWLDPQTERVHCGAGEESICLVNENLHAFSQFLAIWDQYLPTAGALHSQEDRSYRSLLRRILRILDPLALASEDAFWKQLLSGMDTPRESRAGA